MVWVCKGSLSPPVTFPGASLSVREAKVFTCLLPYLLECQAHTNSHARPENLAWLFEAPLCFRNHPFHLMVSSVVLRWTEHRVSWKSSQETAETSFFLPVLQPRKWISLFQGSSHIWQWLWFLTVFSGCLYNFSCLSHTQSLSNKPCWSPLCHAGHAFQGAHRDPGFAWRLKPAIQGAPCCLWSSCSCWNVSRWSPGTLSSVKSSPYNNSKDN